MPITSVIAPVLTSLAVALTGAFDSAQFNPAVLFGSGEPGVFLDANDWGPTGTGGTGVVFQDLSGTAVTAMEQPVQLILDKSQGLKLGTPLTIASWTNFAGIPYETLTTSGSTIISAINTVSSGYAYTSKTNMVSGLWYAIDFNLTLNSGQQPFISTGNNGSSDNLGSLKLTTIATGKSRIYVLYIGDGNDYFWLRSSASADFALTITVQPIAGNHAYVSASANRPTISARYNGVIKTEALDDAAWSKVGATVAVASVALPPGVSRACKITVTAGAGSHYEFLNCLDSYPAGSAVQQSFMVKKDTTQYGWIGDGSDAVWHIAVIDFDAGTITGQYNCTATAVALGNGWFLVTMKYTRTNAGVNRCAVAPFTSSTSTGVPSYTAAGTETMFATGADSRSQDLYVLLPSYQRVNTSTDYDTVGFPVLIKGNGSNQYLTGNLDLSSTNKVTVWNGVRKYTDTGAGCLFGTSADATTNNGAFIAYAPDGTKRFEFGSRGTALAAISTLSASYNAPITAVLTAQADISAPSNSIRINGTIAASGSATQGTGNYGSYPYYIFATGGTANFSSHGFNSIIVLGAAATAAQISMTETYCNQKIKAYA